LNGTEFYHESSGSEFKPLFHGDMKPVDSEFEVIYKSDCSRRTHNCWETFR